MKLFVLKYKSQLILLILLIIVSSLTNMYMAFISRGLVDVATLGQGRGFAVKVLWAVGFIIVSTAFRFFALLTYSSYIRKTMIYLKEVVFCHIIGKSLMQFSARNSAQYISLFNNDLKIIEDDYFKNIFNFIGIVISFTASLIALFLLSPTIMVALLLLTFLSMFIPRLFEQKLIHGKSKVVDSLGKFTVKMNDMYSGFAIVKSFGIEKHMIGQYDVINTEVENNKYKFAKLSAGVNSLSDLFGGFMFISVFIIGSFLTIQNSITLGTMIACVQLTNSVVNPIQMSIQYIAQIRSLRDISTKIMDILQTETHDTKYIRKATIENEILFRDVSFGYNKEGYDLHHLNMRLEKGKKYALVGTSGSGKSTILKLLMKQYETYEGTISVDDVNLKEVSAENWCRLQSVLQQDVFLFDASIQDNITLYEPYEENEMDDVIFQSGLNALITRLPEGVDTQVGENGSVLSGGEKQRIAIARTLMRHAPLVLMDEPTSALDAETAYEIEEMVISLENTLCVIVTHRLSKYILEQYDLIYMFDNGTIVEQGTFKELLEKKERFYTMYARTGEAEMTGEFKDLSLAHSQSNA